MIDMQKDGQYLKVGSLNTIAVYVHISVTVTRTPSVLWTQTYIHEIIRN